MNEELKFLPVTSADYPALTRIMKAAFDEDTALHTDREEDGPRGYEDGSLIERLNERKNFETKKILYQGQIVGSFTVSRHAEREYTLEMLYLDPACRGLHLGTAVWNGIEQAYTEAVKWLLETPDYSTRNHHFYRNKCGFTFLREQRHPNGGNSYVFEKNRTS